MEAAHIVFQLGFLKITSTVVTTWGILLVLGLGSWLATRSLSVASPGLVQTALEGAVQSIEAAIEGVLPGRSALLLPFVGTLWIFVAVANLTGLVPELHSPTGDLSTTAALAFLVFLSVHWFGIRSSSRKTYLHHYLAPSPVLLPFHLLGELSRTLALAVRLGPLVVLSGTAVPLTGHAIALGAAFAGLRFGSLLRQRLPILVFQRALYSVFLALGALMLARAL